MYEEFYGLKQKPFSLLPDPAFLFHSRKHKLALSMLEYAVQSRLSLSVITGEVGSGKTTLVRQLLTRLGESVSVGLISNTHRAFGNLMQWVALAYDLPFKDRDKVELYRDFTEYLIREYAQGRQVLLIVDEAQNLDPETLEELRLLTNVNADDHLLLQILLVGQPELHELLKRHELRQLAQRISISYRLEPLDEAETVAYVRHRIAIAGGDPNIFHKNALRLVYYNSGGIPRVINTLCDLALVYGYADNKKEVDAILVADIARDRIDTGLYGTQVFGVNALKERRPKARAVRGEPAGADPNDSTIASDLQRDVLEASASIASNGLDLELGADQPVVQAGMDDPDAGVAQPPAQDPPAIATPAAGEIPDAAPPAPEVRDQSCAHLETLVLPVESLPGAQARQDPVPGSESQPQGDDDRTVIVGPALVRAPTADAGVPPRPAAEKTERRRRKRRR
ncbi:MAG: AAA family ATPase [Gammaproteobacteria bacterium]